MRDFKIEGEGSGIWFSPRGVEVLPVGDEGLLVYVCACWWEGLSW